jgi:hypothetical protein
MNEIRVGRLTHQLQPQKNDGAALPDPPEVKPSPLRKLQQEALDLGASAHLLGQTDIDKLCQMVADLADELEKTNTILAVTRRDLDRHNHPDYRPMGAL